MSNETRATAAVIDYVTKSGLDRFPSEAVSLAKQCIIDGLGVILAGVVIVLSGLGVGNHRFMCCIHPWMRAMVKVKPRRGSES